ncbi:hypothetical protein LC605_33180 [Nostoc sp. CHAB 5836]|uniref:hypothetical protein n=1 Tax=Nostoc sp. CHAB 5836 TaxID=2780404 RepID=UPI001E52C279|nr:hypothetical protein [Nostoc sp. CHAB 5836]MCC5619782.1 hypothetical protein [Nostoc sp. CHAB 5836]
MTQNNGKTEKISRRREDSQCKDESARLVEHGCNSAINGYDQIGSIATYRSGEDFVRTISKRGEPTFGKVLERLEFIEDAYFHYIDEQQQYLEVRLFETKKHKEVFKKAVQELKQEIYDLVSAEKPEHQE